jgi:uncharacterized protein
MEDRIVAGASLFSEASRPEPDCAERTAMKRPVLVSSLLLLLVCSSMWAQQPRPPAAPASREDILKLFDVMQNREQVRRTMESMVNQSQALMRQQIKEHDPKITDEELAELDREAEEMWKSFPVDQMLEDAVPVYQRHLTKTDVEAMISFYSSPTGQKLLREMPAIMSEGMQAMYPDIQKHMDAAMQRIEEKARKQRQQKKPAPKPESSPSV